MFSICRRNFTISTSILPKSALAFARPTLGVERAKNKSIMRSSIVKGSNVGAIVRDTAKATCVASLRWSQLEKGVPLRQFISFDVQIYANIVDKKLTNENTSFQIISGSEPDRQCWNSLKFYNDTGNANYWSYSTLHTVFLRRSKMHTTNAKILVISGVKPTYHPPLPFLPSDWRSPLLNCKR